jgi:branched-chain amino acid transport system substrate-binding protein
MRVRKVWAAYGALVLIAAVAAVFASTSLASRSAGKPIVIGAAVDLSNNMSFFDDPPLTAAQLEIKKINVAGGVNGRPLELQVVNDQLNPQKTKQAAVSLIGKGVQIGWVTCDADYSTPAAQQFLQKKILTVSPCIGTDQMGPKRYGAAGKLAYSFGNVAQDEGAAMAEYAYKKLHARTAITMGDNATIYFQNVIQAFTKRFTQLGGKIVLKQSFTQGDKTISNVVTHVARQKADVIAISTYAADLATGVQGIRSLGDKTPFIGPWSTDGAYWVPKSLKLSGFYYVTYASVFGNDPSPQVRSLIAQMKKVGKPPATGGFITGAAAIDAIATAIKRAGGSTDGAKLAAVFEKFHGLPTISGPISFSAGLHSVYGRPYRVIEIHNGQHVFKELFKASSPAQIP